MTARIGIDLGGTNISAALADAEGNIAAVVKTPTGSHEGPDAVLARMASLVNDLASTSGARPAALGIGVPGLVDVKNGITKWILGWKRNGWRTAAKKPVINQDLWVELDDLSRAHSMEWTWTKGHADHADNNRCDELATRAAREGA